MFPETSEPTTLVGFWQDMIVLFIGVLIGFASSWITIFIQERKKQKLEDEETLHRIREVCNRIERVWSAGEGEAKVFTRFICTV